MAEATAPRRASSRARPPPSELPATCGRTRPCSANQRSRYVVRPAGLGSAVSAAEPPKPGRSTAMTRRSRARAPITGSHMPRWLPVPCRSTSVGPEPWVSKARAMVRGESLRKVVCVRLGCCVAPTAASRETEAAAVRGAGRRPLRRALLLCGRPATSGQDGSAQPGVRAARSPCTLRARFATRSTGRRRGWSLLRTPEVPKSSHPLGRLQRPLRNARDRTPKPHTPEDDDPRPEPPAASLPLDASSKRHETAAQRQRTEKLLHSG